ncbi:amphiregulin [Pelodytes ibericus]
MSSHLSLFLCITLLFAIACQFQVYCSTSNNTDVQVNATFFEASQDSHGAVQEEEDGEDEDHDEDFSVAGYIIDDSIRVQPVIKPENTQKKTEKKTTEKKAKKKNNKNDKTKKKKKNPCQTTHKDFCIHGECRYLANIKEVSCRCKQDYFGERCSEMYMKSETKSDFGDVSTVALAVAAVLLSTISIVAIIIIIIVHTRRKYSSYECEAEEKRKLGQENGSEEIDV